LNVECSVSQLPSREHALDKLHLTVISARERAKKIAKSRRNICPH